MKPNRRHATLLLLMLAPVFCTGQILDQSQLVYNSGISARTLPGYSIFQSFTAGITGTMVEIDMGVFNAISGNGTLKVYQGFDTSGAVLQNLQVSVNCSGGSCFAAFAVSVPVTAGQAYTFHFTPGTGIPDPYGVQAQVPGTYAGGQFGLIDPSGIYYPGFDLVFKTFVQTSTGIETMAQGEHPLQVFPNPARQVFTLSGVASLQNGRVVIENSSGQTVRIYNGIRHPEHMQFDIADLPPGVYVVRLFDDNRPSSVCKMAVIR